MKNIIIATDYSAVSQNATRYGAALAKHMKAKLILYHAFYFQETFSDVLVVAPTLQELQTEHGAKLEAIRKNIAQTYQIPVKSVTSHSPLVEELPRLVTKYGTDLVVMGMKNLSLFDRKVFGSMTTSVMNMAKFPVLLIPEKATFNGFKHILFPYDSQSVTTGNTFRLLKEVALTFHSLLYLLHVTQPEPETILIEQKYSAKNYNHIEEVLQEIKHEYVFVEEENIAQGINKAMLDNQVDLIAMVPHRHGFWDRFMNRSVTTRMAFQTHIPLLTMPNPEES